MKAARLHGVEDLRIDEMAEPTPGPGQVKLRNAYTGICGSDLHLYFAPEGARVDVHSPHPLTGATFPQILGHECSATVVEVGAGVTTVHVGDRVALWPIHYCGRCTPCRLGQFNLCRTIGFHGLSAPDGGMAEFSTVDAARVHRLPPGVDLRLGALVEPMAVAWRAVARSAASAGQSVLIAGAGPIGVGLWFALRAHGVQRVLVSEPNPMRRQAIAALGASVVDPGTGGLTEAVATLTNGDGVDVGFDAAGAAPALESAVESTRPGGRVVVVAIHERAMEFNPSIFARTEIELSGSFAYLQQDFDEVIAAMAEGMYDPTGWVEEVDLDGVGDAIQGLRAGRGSKVLVNLGSDRRAPNGQ